MSGIVPNGCVGVLRNLEGRVSSVFHMCLEIEKFVGNVWRDYFFLELPLELTTHQSMMSHPMSPKIQAFPCHYVILRLTNLQNVNASQKYK